MRLNHFASAAQFYWNLNSFKEDYCAGAPQLAAHYFWLLCCQEEMSVRPHSWWSEELWILSSDWRGSSPKMNGLLHFKWQTHFFPSTRSLSCILVTFLSNNRGSPFKGACGKTGRQTSFGFWEARRKKESFQQPRLDISFLEWLILGNSLQGGCQ